MLRSLRLGLAIGAVLTWYIFLGASSVYAGNYTVQTTADLPHITCYVEPCVVDTQCLTPTSSTLKWPDDPGGPCSLRAAFSAANSSAFPPGGGPPSAGPLR